MSENNEASIEANCFKGGFTLKASRLGGAVLRPPVLGPSTLGSIQTNSNHSSTSIAGSEKTDDEKAASGDVTNNPFLREQKEDNDEELPAEVESTTAKSEKDEDEIDERPDPLTLLRNNGMDRANMFAAAKTSMPRVETTGFVFGQNVHERVVGENVATENHVEATADGTPEASSSQLLFSSVIQKAAKSTENNDCNNKEAEAKSLTDVAREYEESRAQKRKYEEVETFTGEENEINIVDVSCKLFAFVNSNWEERGRGSLRLNDAKDARDCSRVVFRTSGNLRLLLNTKVWAAMVAERASQKSLRLTAMDNTGTVKIFLAMGRPADIALLHKALSERISKRKLSHPEECAAAGSSVEQTKNGVASKTEAVLALQPESTTHDDDDEDDLDIQPVVVKAAADCAEADSNEQPSPKKPLMAADSSADVELNSIEAIADDDGAEAAAAGAIDEEEGAKN